MMLIFLFILDFPFIKILVQAEFLLFLWNFRMLTWFFWCNRLTTIEDLAKAMNKKLTQGMAEHNKAMAAAKTEDEKELIVGFP